MQTCEVFLPVVQQYSTTWNNVEDLVVPGCADILILCIDVWAFTQRIQK